jgi:hypothetical protein
LCFKYAYSAIAAFESCHAIKNKLAFKPVTFSQQPLISCDKNTQGCSGGFPSYSFDYMKTYGNTPESAYAVRFFLFWILFLFQFNLFWNIENRFHTFEQTTNNNATCAANPAIASSYKLKSWNYLSINDAAIAQVNFEHFYFQFSYL